MRKTALSVIGATLVAIAGAAFAQTTLPRPVLHFTGHEHYSAAGQNFVRYRFDVVNKAEFPVQLFAAAPTLPPCGSNKNSSRTWVDFFDQSNRRLYGFCALSGPEQLGTIWFALPEDQDPPARVYIEMTDRQTNTRYRSNAERIP